MNNQKVKMQELTIDGTVYVPKDSQQTKVIQLDGTECEYEIGKCYLIRTVTMIQLGRVKSITPRSIILENACWVADTGRFSEALSTGKLNEVEMFVNDVIVSFGGIIDATEWTSELPIKTK